MRSVARALVGAVVIATLAGVVVSGADQGVAAARSGPRSTGNVTTAKGVTRTILAEAEPTNAAGQKLYLERVVIAPGAVLAEHYHAGAQVARVESGSLVYRIASGTAPVVRASGATKELVGPTSVVLHAGDTVTETSELVHSGSNRTKKPVRVVIAALLADGAGLATPVGQQAPGTEIDVSADFTVTENRLSTIETPNGTRLYGTAIESADSVASGSAAPADRSVHLELAEQIDYTNGSGPWSGILTYRFGDGSTIVGTVTGATIVSADGGARFAGTVAVIGGTGAYATVSGGSGTYTGGRSGALGAVPLPTQVALRVLTS